MTRAESRTWWLIIATLALLACGIACASDVGALDVQIKAQELVVTHAWNVAWAAQADANDEWRNWSQCWPMMLTPDKQYRRARQFRKTYTKAWDKYADACFKYVKLCQKRRLAANGSE